MTDKEIIIDFDEFIDKTLGFVTSETQGDIGFIINKLKEQLQRKTAECEELKKQCDEHRSNAESYCRSYQNSCIVNGKMTDRALRYKQALDEILELIDREDWSILDYVNKGIKDIINKAKGKSNG